MQKQQETPTKTQENFRILGPVAVEFSCSNTGSWRLEKPNIEYDLCTKCRICERYCPANVITIHKDQEECVVIDMHYCKGCGICANECPTGCLTMVDERGEE